MNFNSKKMCLSFLLYFAGSFAGVEPTLGFHGLLLKNKLRAKISELINQYTLANSETISSSSNHEIKSFLEKTTEKINKLAHQKDIEAKNTIEWIQKTKNLSVDEMFSLAIKNDDYRKAMSLEKNRPTVQADLTFECLETLNNIYLLESLENPSAFMSEILNCMNAAELEAQE